MTQLATTWTPTQEDFDLFAKISGDDNPIHVDPVFSAGSAFGRTVSHGMLIYSKLWAMVKQAYPEATQHRQHMMFPNPCFTGEEVILTVSGEIPGTIAMVASRTQDGAHLFIGGVDVK